ncbi:hypothetical protein SERLA73DRAFT_68021 [Serpula lacrymans var. lacrymans S7.3]|uniref:Retrotransposon gag domain-containing protein n=2 Tax=Serpula lacrymans var. lacrymans TaxID=341189 RepID=F8PG79_SERL3|nr:uncharacterized protein SERLADRAFT_431728 [Serpula lacrymans var. lacrymans S7.9]EGO04326.1 hypothetical protein SERLA73DRAFT_68021 [Serpula lacrymans var. lacrymans S7.3]EGO30243.1 hypothetical protein SERLADRAFT_431728 [Serpula lacrymans var. lacrymans S7.9]
MRAQIMSLTMQLSELQTNPPKVVERKSNKKVKTVADPGTFEGDQARFAECDSSAVKTQRPVVGQYTQVRLQECYTANHWPTWDDLKGEIEKYFKPQAGRDWAHQPIRSFKQGNMRTDDFLTWILALSI